MTTLDLANHNGEQVVREKAIEELGELIEAIKSNDINNLIDEVADAKIMLEQIIHTYVIYDEVESRYDYKIKRTKERLGL